VRVFVAGLATATALLVACLLHPPQPSAASFTATKSNAGNSIGADAVSNYLRLYSQGSDPAGLTGYAVKNNSSPSVLAAAGSDLGLSLALGGWKNAGTMNRVLTLQAAGTLPRSPSPRSSRPCPRSRSAAPRWPPSAAPAGPPR
jgi:hypothetical protein